MASTQEISFLEKDVEFIQVITVDINGLARGKVFPFHKLVDLLRNKEEMISLEQLYGTKSEEVTSIQEITDGNYEDVVIVPDKSTLVKAPWSRDSELAIMFADIYERKTNSPWPFNPRLLTKNKLKELEEMKMKLLIGVDNEYRLIDKITKQTITNGFKSMSQLHQATIVLPYMRELIKDLKKFDISIESWNITSGNGQIKVPLAAYAGMGGVDKEWMFKEISKYVADRMGLIASYMSFPFSNSTANEMCINHSLWTMTEKGLTNVMWEPEKENELSDVGKSWLAGILKHTRALCAFFSPTVNCYRKMRTSHCTPRKVSWNYQNRLAAMRIKTSQDIEKFNYIENHLPSSACNIYLAIAAMVVAGIDGIKNKLQLQEPGNESLCKRLPMSLSESLEALKEDKILIEGLGEKFVEWYIKVKQETEIKLLRNVDLDDDSPQGISLEWDKYSEL